MKTLQQAVRIRKSFFIMMLVIGVLIASKVDGQWVSKNNGLYGGQINSIVNIGSNIFAGTSNGVFLTSNNGTSWTSVSTGLPNNPYIYTLLLSGTTLFAATNNGVYLSTNNGTSWATTTNTGRVYSTVTFLTINGGNLYAGSYNGTISVSADNGTTWTSLTSLPSATNQVTAMYFNGSNFFAAAYNQVFLSTNGGSSWTSITTGLPSPFYSVYDFISNGPNLFVATGSGVYVSTNNGASWTAVNGIQPSTYVYKFLVSGGTLYAATGSGIGMSTNNGSTWTAINTGADTNVFSLLVSGNNIFAGSNSSGVYFSGNLGTSWTNASTGITASSVISLINAGTNLVAGTAGGIYVSTDNAASWSLKTAIIGNQVIAQSFSQVGTNLFAATNYGVLLSADNGLSWAVKNTGLSSNYIYQLAVVGSSIFAATIGGIYMSTNNGTNWTLANSGIASTASSLAVIGSNIFACGYNSGVYISSNNGTTWTAVNSGFTNLNVANVTANGTKLYVFNNNGPGYYVSSDNGTSWTATDFKINGNLSYVGKFTFYNTAIFTDNGGIYMSLDNGTTWSYLQQNGNTFLINGANMFVGTYGAGVVESPITYLNPTITTPVFPTTYTSGSNMTTSITFDDATKANAVTLKVRGLSDPVASTKTYNPTLVGNTYQQVLSASALNDPLGISYYFQYNTYSGSVQTATTEARPQFLATSTDQAIPNLSFGAQVSNYQIVSIPLKLDDSSVTTVFKALGAYSKPQWRLFSYTSGDNLEYPGFSTIDPGKGYWLIVRTSTTINPGSGTTLLVNEATPFTLNLVAGWNLIGNPYNFRLSWDDVLAANPTVTGLGAKLKVFNNGTLTDASVVDKYRGAFIFSTGAAIVKVPVLRNTTIGGRTAEQTVSNSIDQLHWEVKLKLTEGELSNELGGIGMDPKSTVKGKDQYDEVSVPLPDGLGLFEVSFPHPEFFTTFSKEMVPTQDNYAWEFSVKRSDNSNPVLTWDNRFFGDNDKQLLLFDPISLQAIDMRKETSLALASSTNKLHILYGDTKYVNEQLDEKLPLLAAPYPNPAKEELTIPFRVPESLDQSTVTIRIYNSNGQQVASPVNQTFSQGSYNVKWYPNNSPGLYLIRMKIGALETTAVKVILE